MSHSTIISPRTGIIVSCRTDKGYRPYFTRGIELCELAPLDPFLIEVTLLESEIGDIKEGDMAEVMLWMHMGTKIKGMIKKIAPVSVTYNEEKEQDNKGVENKFKVTIAIHNIPSKILRPYLSGTVRIFAGNIRGITLLAKLIRSALRADLFY